MGALQLSHGLRLASLRPRSRSPTCPGRRQFGAAHPHGLDTLVVFVSPTCPVCKSLLPALRSIRRHEKPALEVVLASDGSRLEHTDFVAAEGLEEFTYVLSEPLGIAFGAGRLPHAVLIDGGGSSGRAGSSIPANTWTACSRRGARSRKPAGLGTRHRRGSRVAEDGGRSR